MVRPAAAVPRFVDRIGVGVGTAHLRAVGLRAGRIAWAIESPVSDDEPLAAALERFLLGLPLHRWQRWPRPAVRAVLGARYSQVKRLSGLPPGIDGRHLARLVQEGAPRFFLRNGHPLVTTGIEIAADGARWGAALDADAVDALRGACRAAGLRLACVAPVAAVLPIALESDAGASVRWNDDGAAIELLQAGGHLAAVARIGASGRVEDVATASSRPHPRLAALGDEAARFADAYGVACLPLDAALLHRPQRTSSAPSRISRWRTAVAVLALLLAGAAALLARPVAAIRAERAATQRLAELGAVRAEAARLERDLAQVSAALIEVEAFAARRRSPTMLLAGLTRALPEGSALVAVRTDTSGVVASLLAPRAAPVLGALERIPGIVAPEIVGPVTRETVGAGSVPGGPASGASVERMTVRFRLLQPTAERRL